MRQQDAEYAVAEAADRARNEQDARERAAAQAHGLASQPARGEAVDISRQTDRLECLLGLLSVTFHSSPPYF